MAAKKTSGKKITRSGFQTTIRLTDHEFEEFERAAEFEGFSSIASWMLDQAKWRSELVKSAMATGGWIEIRGKKILISDLPADVVVPGSSDSSGENPSQPK